MQTPARMHAPIRGQTLLLAGICEAAFIEWTLPFSSFAATNQARDKEPRRARPDPASALPSGSALCATPLAVPECHCLYRVQFQAVLLEDETASCPPNPNSKAPPLQRPKDKEQPGRARLH